MADVEKPDVEKTAVDPSDSTLLEFDDILGIIGEFGRWQRILFVLVSLIGIFTGMNTLAQVFMAGESEHWCRVAAWDGAACDGLDDWDCLVAKRNASVPPLTSPDGTPAVGDDGSPLYDSCLRYDVQGKNFSLEADPGYYVSNATVTCEEADGWVYDTRQYVTTIISEFNLVCNRRSAVSVSQSIYFAGLLVGSFFFGSLADCIGRKLAIYIATIVFMISGVANVFAPSGAVYVTFRFFIAAGGIGAYLCGYVLVAEFVGPSKRVLVGISIQFFFATGLTILPLLAGFIREWRFLQLCITLPAILYFLLYFYMPESARWQMSRGRYKEAEKTLRRVANGNRKDFPSEMFDPDKLSAAEEKSSGGQQTAAGLFRTPNMRLKTINLLFNWFVNSLVYYGLGLSTSDLGVNDYLASFLSALIEFPSYIYCIFGLQYFGRRLNLSVSMVIGGTACVITAFLEIGVARTVIAMIGKFCIAGSFAMIYVVSGEIYPTPVRSAGMGLSSTAARVAGILSPIMLEMSSLWKPMPFVVFGGLSILAGLLALFLPETNNKKLPETLEEGEEFGKPRCLGGKGDDDDAVGLVTVAMSDVAARDGIDNPAVEKPEGVEGQNKI